MCVPLTAGVCARAREPLGEIGPNPTAAQRRRALRAIAACGALLTLAARAHKHMLRLSLHPSRHALVHAERLPRRRVEEIAGNLFQDTAVRGVSRRDGARRPLSPRPTPG